MKSSVRIGEVLSFLRRLSANNDRAWFKAHRDEFDAVRLPWEEDMARLITLVGEWDDNVRGLPLKDCVYRIYRDVRFSHDKSPYKRYFSGVLGRGGRHTVMSCAYVHFEPGNVMLGGGLWWPEKELLRRVRALIDAEGEEFLSIVNAPAISRRYRWECDTLKTLPADYRDYPKDGPLAPYLRMKEYILMMRPDESYFDCDDWVERVAGDLRPLKPLHDFINYVFD